MSRFRTGREDKPTWSAVPAGVKAEVERVLGARVASARRVWGGYAPSGTFRLKLEGGAAFFKGVNVHTSPFMTAALRRETRAYVELPAIRPWTPAFLGTLAVEDWEVLLLEFVADAAAVPAWKAEYAEVAASALARLHNAFARKPLPDWLPPPTDVLFGPHHGDATGWRGLHKDPEAMALYVNIAGQAKDEVPQWLERHLAELIELEGRVSSIGGPATLLHMDARSDNLLFRKNGSVALVDWSHPCAGAGAIDAAAFFISVAAEDGPAPEQMLSWYSGALDHRMDEDDLNSAVAACAGYFASRAGLPDVPGGPRIRSFQRTQLASSLRWLTRRLGWQEPSWLSHI